MYALQRIRPYESERELALVIVKHIIIFITVGLVTPLRDQSSVAPSTVQRGRPKTELRQGL